MRRSAYRARRQVKGENKPCLRDCDWRQLCSALAPWSVSCGPSTTFALLLRCTNSEAGRRVWHLRHDRFLDVRPAGRDRVLAGDANSRSIPQGSFLATRTSAHVTHNRRTVDSTGGRSVFRGVLARHKRRLEKDSFWSVYRRRDVAPGAGILCGSVLLAVD